MTVALAMKHCRLKYLSKLNMGQSPPSEAVTRFDEGDGLPFLQGNAEFGAVSPSYKHTCTNPPKTAMTGDLLVSVRAPVGALNIADQPYGIGRGLCSVKWIYIEPRFGWWALHYHRSKLNEVATGSTYEAVSAEDLGNLVLSFPDEQLQRFVANYLDRETSHIDRLIAEKERMLALLEEKRAALISRVVTRGLDPNAPLRPSGQEWLGDIPAHWEVRRIKFVTACLDQGSSPIAANTPAGPDELGVLKLSAVSKGRFNREENKALRGADNQEQLLALRRGDVLITRGNTPELVADVACVPEDEPNLLLPDLIYRLRVNKEEILPAYLTAFLTTAAARVPIRRDARGSSGSMVKVSQGHVLNWMAPLPPFSEQEDIVSYLRHAEEQFESTMKEVSSSLFLLSERRAALITAAVTGQISLEEIAP